MVVLREYHPSEKDFILNYLKDQQNISERINVNKMPSIDEVLRSQLKMFPISSDQGQADMKQLVLDIPATYSTPPTLDKSSVIETKIRGILANKSPTDFAVKMFEPLSNIVRKPTINVKPIAKSPSTKATAITPKAKSPTGKQIATPNKSVKAVKIKTPETNSKPESKLTGGIKKDKLIKPKAKALMKGVMNSSTKGATAKLTRTTDVLKSRSAKPLRTGNKIKKIKIDRGPKVVKQGSVSFPRLVKLEKPQPKTIKRKKLPLKTPEKKVTKPINLPLKIA